MAALLDDKAHERVVRKAARKRKAPERRSDE
jgi:hypothetical protein